MKTATIVYGDLSVERASDGNISITRQSTAQRVVVSLTEWVYLVQLLDVLTLPVAPPTPESEGNTFPS